MDDLDHLFARMRAEPLPAALDALDGNVMAGFAAGRERRTGRKAIGLACAVAAVVGLWGGLSGPVPETAHDRTLLALPDAAPSHLLES